MKRLKKILAITGIVIASIIVLALFIVALFNVLKFAIYKDYYAIEQTICKNPGLNDGFVCQGITTDEEEGVILVAGYMDNGSASRIYVTDKDSNSYFVTLKRNGKDFTGHAGGIATTNKIVYIANGGKIYSFPLASVLSAKNGDCVEIGSGVNVNTNASFVYTDEEYLYVGEFNDGGKYTITGHENETAEGTHYALCTQYDLDDLTAPVKVYSIRNNVQGICFAKGKVVMSTSFGITSSVYYVYELANATDSGKTFDGAPLYYLDDLSFSLQGPAMSEDVDYTDGKIITLSESASNKYIFGKFFNATHIVSLDIFSI